MPNGRIAVPSDMALWSATLAWRLKGLFMARG
jgi:hypothetical protein